MAARQFPALGFDPAPGDPAALAASARALAAAADTVAGAGVAAARLESGGWRGAAGDGLRSRLAPLPRDLDRAGRAHAGAAAALGRYGAELWDRQLRAAGLEALAAELRRRLPATGDGLSSAQAALVPAVEEQLRQAVAAARRLHEEHVAAAAATATALRAASDPPYGRPGRLSRAVSGVKAWVSDHADVLVQISTVLKGVSAALGTVSLVPGMHFLAPLAIATGAAALGIDVAVRAATGRGSWAGLALDAALIVVPGGPVGRAVRRLPGLAPVLRAANRAVPAAVKGRVFRAAGNTPDGVGVGQMAAAAALIRRHAAHYGDDVVVQGSRAGYSTRAASDIDIGLRVSPARFEAVLRERFGDPVSEEFAEVMGRCRAKGIVHARRAGMRMLGEELEALLGCKVDISVIRRGGRFDQEPWLPL